MRTSLLAGVVVFMPLLLGCMPELPSLEYRGQRVEVGSDEVARVCQGTLNRMDREVEHIEARLDIPVQDSRIDVYVVDSDTVDAYCSGAASCTSFPWKGAPIILLDPQNFNRALTHELVHARLAASRSTPLLTEGIAEAASSPSCPRTAPDVEIVEVVDAKAVEDWPDVSDTYYLAGELVAWLLDEFGPGEVLSLMRALPKGASSSSIQSKYLEHFDRELEADFLTHVRTQADLDALPSEYFGCLTAPLDASTGPLRLLADLDCDSDRVHNNFGVEGSGYVEWTVELDHEQTLELVGDVPFGTSLTIEECGCIPKKGEDDHLLARPVDAVETLQPGSYRLRWIGDLDAGLSLDVELVPLQA